MKVATIFLLVCLFLVACTLGGSPKIINHERPDIQVDFSPFKDVGCKSSGYGWYDCGEQSPLYELGCLYISKNELLGGFAPAYPIAMCGYFFYEVDGTEAISSSIDLSVECFSYTVMINGTSCGRFVIFKDGNYLLVKNFDELRTLFAPVDSPQEALSFALAISDYSAQYGQTKNSKYVYSVSEVEDTFVETIADGYLVHLFYTPSVGCGPFNTEAVEVKVTFDGFIQEMNRYPIYRDPSNDELCID